MVPSGHYGKVTGNYYSGTGTKPHLSHFIIGIGVPQYLCLDISQSFNLAVVPGLAFNYKYV